MLLNLDAIDPELLSGLEALPDLTITRDNVHQVRELLASMPQPETPATLTVTRHAVPADGREVEVLELRRSADAMRPALLWIHGGGYLLGTADDTFSKDFAQTIDCAVFSVEYRLAPEHPFPAGMEDCHAALDWLVQNAADLDVDPERIAIGGASAGGGMAAGLALLNRERLNHPLALQLLLYPMIDNLHDTPSGRFANHPVWKRETSFNAWEMYLDGTPGASASPFAAPARAEDLAGLPPAYVCVGSVDLFRDENIDYARRLHAADVPCELAVLAGLYHGGDNFVPQAAVSQRLRRGVIGALAQRLGAELFGEL